MKQLNEEKRFDQVFQIFDTYNKENNPTSLPSRMIIEILKACTRTGDIKRAQDIHSRLSSSNQRDPFIISSLINFYSKLSLFLINKISLVFDVSVVHSRDVTTAESLFNKVTTKELPLYGIMMKGM
jgi:hypothetical protein